MVLVIKGYFEDIVAALPDSKVGDNRGALLVVSGTGNTVAIVIIPVVGGN